MNPPGFAARRVLICGTCAMLILFPRPMDWTRLLVSLRGPLPGRRSAPGGLGGDGEDFRLTELAEHAAAVEKSLVERTAELERANHALAEKAASHWRLAENAREEARLNALAAEVGRALAVRQELRPSLQRCAELLVQHLDAAYARLWTLEDGGQWLRLQASAGMFTHLDGTHGRVAVGQRVPVGELKIGRIAADQMPRLINDVMNEGDGIDREWAQREGLVAFVGYPLVVDGATVGVMAAFARHPLSSAALEAMSTVADVIAMGIVRRQEEDGRRRERERYRALVSSLPDVVWCADGNGRITAVSDAVYAISGFTTAEVLSQAEDFWLSRLHPKDLPRMRAAVESFLAGQAEYDVEYRFRHKDGSWRWLHDRGFRGVGADGEPFVEGLCRDITRQREAESRLQAMNADLELLVAQRTEALVRAERRYRAFFDQDLSAVFVTDRRGIVLDCNLAFARYLSFTSVAEARGCDFRRMASVTPDWRHLLSAFFRRGRLEGCELRLAKRDGETMDVLANLIGEFEGKHLRHIRGYFFDITERKRADVELRELPGRILSAQDEERRRIARELHDSTAQNLAALTMTLCLLERRTDDLGPTAAGYVREALRLAEESAREIRTTSYVLHPPLLEEAGLEAALRWYCEGFARRSGLVIEVEVKGNPAALDDDAALAAYRIVQEALMNVYRHSGGPRARVLLAQQDGEVVVEVRDEGRGILAAADPAAAGVGIAGMHERMARVGGRLSIASSGAGTSVRGAIPVRVP
jgi:PAS domain S-box-containing protein